MASVYPPLLCLCLPNEGGESLPFPKSALPLSVFRVRRQRLFHFNMSDISDTGADERTSLIGEAVKTLPSNGGLSRQPHKYEEEVGGSSTKELSSGRLILVLGVVWFGSFLAAFGNKNTGAITYQYNIRPADRWRQTQRWLPPSRDLSLLL